MKYVKGLDGLRAVAILMVMLAHYKTVEAGWIGVEIFFVLSGYLITSILIAAKSEPLGFYLKRFYWRRSLRIFPLYYLYIGILLAAFYCGYRITLLPNLPYLLTYTFNFTSFFDHWKLSPMYAHFWSLAAEEQFYLIWPMLIYFLNTKNTKRLLIALIVGCPILRYAFAIWLRSNGYGKWDEIIYEMMFTQLDAFAFGAAIVVFDLPSKIKNPVRWSMASLLALLALGYVNMVNLNLSPKTFGFSAPPSGNLQYVWAYTLVHICSALGVIAILSRKLDWIFANRFMVSIGKISYGMYIYHWAIQYLFGVYLWKYGIKIGYKTFPLHFLLVYAVSWVSYNLFEKYFMSLKDKFNCSMDFSS